MQMQDAKTAPAAGRSSWLCRDDFDRERVLDMEHRIAPARKRTFTILFFAILSVGAWIGWWPLLFLLPSSIFFLLADRFMPRLERPELLMFAAWVVSEATVGGAVALEGSAHVASISWLAIPVITLASRFSMRGVVAGVSIACALVLTVGFGIDHAAALHSPDVVVAPLALILCVAVLSTPLMHSDLQHRNDSVIDQLTGMLNRKALEVRVHELELQSEITGEPVGVIVADLDHFKQINDTHGHATGDAVLREVAYLLRKHLRAFDLAYRLGGEEFLILLPGSDIDQTATLAARLREGICNGMSAAGPGVTISIGVGASVPDSRFDYAQVFAKADAALYRAKRAGRNRVELAQDAPAVAAVAAQAA